MTILRPLVGAALLFFGRKVFWLFVAGAGFIAGMSLASRTLDGRPDWLTLVIGLGVGLVAALIAVFLKRFAIGMAGFFVGGYLALQILPFFNLEAGLTTWVAFIIGGIIGVILVAAILDWALIILSSLAGASVLIGTFEFFENQPGLGLVATIILFAIGVSVQAKGLRKEKG